MIDGEAAYARQRTRPMLTAWAVRKRMVDELSEYPEGFKRRSLGKRLTKLDKALTDLEAYSLDRAFSAWLITAGKSSSVDVSGSNVRGNEQSEPLSEAELREIGKYRNGLKNMFADWRFGKMVSDMADRIFSLMAPWAERQSLEGVQFKLTIALARQLTQIYVGDFKKGA